MNKKIVSLFLMFIFVLSLATYSFADERFFSFSEPKNEKEQKIKDEVDMKVDNFKGEVDLDVSKAFGISLEGYTLNDMEKILKSDDVLSRSLSAIYWEIINDAKPGDVLPSIYTKANTGFVLVKKADGTNYLYTIKLDTTWKITDFSKKEGKYIEPPK